MISLSLADIAQKISATIIGDDKKIISGVAPLYRATENQLSYLASAAYEKDLENTKAGAVIIAKAHAEKCHTTALIVDNPELAFARIAALFDSLQKPAAGIHATAVIAKTAVIHPSATIGAQCVIGENAVIGEHSILMPGVIVHDDAHIGADCFLYSHVTICHHVEIHNRVIVHSGAVIGADGFSLVQDRGKFEKMPQLGRVIIHDDVEVGANTCIDRGALDDTVVEMGVKIDNLVQIAHNVRIGAHTVIAGCVCIAGSTTIGRHCMIGGVTTIAGHLTICDGAVFTGRSAVTGSVKTPGVYSSGTGLMPNNEWRRNVVRFRQLDQWVKKVNQLLSGK